MTDRERELEDVIDGLVELIALRKTESQRLRAHIVELEALLAIQHGSLAQPTPEEPATFVHDVAPNAPR